MNGKNLQKSIIGCQEHALDLYHNYILYYEL